jgi:uncharacterized protein YjiS (DUF1127 family)
MALFETTRSTDGLGPRGLRSNLFVNLTSALMQWNDARITRKALDGLTDHELDDIGLCRGDIEAIAGRGTRA